MTIQNLRYIGADEASGDLADASFSAADFKVPFGYLEMLVGRGTAVQSVEITDLPRNGRGQPMVPALQFLEICLKKLRASQSETLGGGGARQTVPFGTFGLIISSMIQANDFEEALRRGVDALHILRPDMAISFNRQRGDLRLDLQFRPDAPVDLELCLEFFALALHSAFRWLTGDRLRPAKVEAARLREGHEHSMLTVLCCPVLRRGSGVTIYYPADVAGVPIRAVKYENWGAQELPEFMRLLREAAQEIKQTDGPGPALIVADIAQHIGSGIVSEKAMAARLGMSTASLRRRLAEEGTSFRAILADVRRESVHQLFLSDKTLDAIAEEIGYSDVRSLRRACVRWFGVSADQYRRAILHAKGHIPLPENALH